MRDLDEIDDYAAELGLPPPSGPARACAKRLIKSIISATPEPYSVGPWEDGAIALGVTGAPGHGVGVYCLADGSVRVIAVRPGGGTDEKFCPPAEVGSNDLQAFIVQSVQSLQKLHAP